MIVPKDENYRKILGNLESKNAMNLKCGACSSCTGSGGGGGKACKCTGVSKVEKIEPYQQHDFKGDANVSPYFLKGRLK